MSSWMNLVTVVAVEVGVVGEGAFGRSSLDGRHVGRRKALLLATGIKNR